MKATIADSGVGNLRREIAANVRAELARASVRTNHLPRLVGGSQSYWSRRVNGDLPFTTDDLGRLARLLNVDMGTFVDLGSSARSTGSIYFHGKKSSHSDAPPNPPTPPAGGDNPLGIAS